jgi:hypothetical protein
METYMAQANAAKARLDQWRAQMINRQIAQAQRSARGGWTVGRNNRDRLWRERDRAAVSGQAESA